jgi:hypothetical protein
MYGIFNALPIVNPPTPNVVNVIFTGSNEFFAFS